MSSALRSVTRTSSEERVGYFRPLPGAAAITTSETCVAGSGTGTMASEFGLESGRAAASPSRWPKAVRKSSEMRLNSVYTSAPEAEGAGEAAERGRGGGFSSTGSGLGVIRVRFVEGSAF